MTPIILQKKSVLLIKDAVQKVFAMLLLKKNLNLITFKAVAQKRSALIQKLIRCNFYYSLNMSVLSY